MTNIFVIHRIDAEGKSDERAAHREEHLVYLNAFNDNILAAGPYTDPANGQDRGSMFLVSFDRLEDAKAFADDDPFTKAGMFSELQVWPWHQRLGLLKIEESS